MCKTVEGLAADRDALEKALGVKENIPLKEKIGDILKRIADRVMAFFKGDKALQQAAHNRYAHVFLEDVQTLREMADIVSQGFENARENERKFGKAQSAERFAKTADKKKAANEVKLQERNNNAILELIDRYTEREYNNYGWAIINNVLSNKEQMKLLAQFADKETLNSKYQRSYDDYYMIPVGEEYSYNEKIVFIDGTNQSPIIDRIVKVYGENEAVIGFCLQEVIENAGQHESLDYLGEIAGEKVFEQYTSADFETYSTLKEKWQKHTAASTSHSNENRGRTRSAQKYNDAIKNQNRTTDTAYLSAVERGDMDTAQRMVDEAAEKMTAWLVRIVREHPKAAA